MDPAKALEVLRALVMQRLLQEQAALTEALDSLKKALNLQEESGGDQPS